MRIRQTIVKGTAWAAMANALSAGLTFVTLFVLARLLGPDEFGVFALVWSILTIFGMLGDFGVGSSVAKYLAEESTARRGLVRSILRDGLYIKLVSGVLFSLLCFLAAHALGVIFHDPRLVDPLQIGALIPLFGSVIEFCKFVFKSQTDIRQVAVISGVEFGGKLVLAVLLVVLGYGATGAIAGHVIATGAAAMLALWRVYIHLYRPHPPCRGSRWRSILAYCLPFIAIAFAAFVYTEMSNVLIGFFSDSTEVGYYNSGKTIARVLTIVAVTLGSAIGPSFVQLRTRQGDEISEAFHQVLNYSLILLTPLAVLIWGLASLVVPLIFGQEYSPGISVLQILAPFVLASGLSAIVSPISDYLGKAKFRAVALIPTVLAYLVLGAILVPHHGARGAAWAVTITYIPYGLANVIYVSRLCKVSSRLLGKQALKSLLPALVMVMVLVLGLFATSTLLSAALIAAGACILYFLGLFVTRSLTLQQIIDLVIDLRQLGT